MPAVDLHDVAEAVASVNLGLDRSDDDVPDLIATFRSSQLEAERRARRYMAEQVEELLSKWIRRLRLDEEDIRLLAEDLITATRSSDSSTELEKVIREWTVTAQVLVDPLSRDVLLGSAQADDFEPLPRPE